MNIERTEYLSNDEIKSIIKSELRSEVRALLRDENNIKRIISNSAYEQVYMLVDETMKEPLQDVLAVKVREIIEGLSGFNVFKRPDAWDREPNSAYKMLKSAIDSNSGVIKETVNKLVSEQVEAQTLLYLKEDLNGYIIEAVQDLFTLEKGL